MSTITPSFWVRYNGGGTAGPFSKPELIQKIQAGEIRPTNDIMEQGGTWAPLSSRPDLTPAPIAGTTSRTQATSKPVLQTDVTKYIGWALLITGGVLMASLATGLATPLLGIIGLALALVGLIVRLMAPKS
ncbi:GYF domain-containing protein [Verrucomicrobium spinosum]|uniref:GYF domain-containing protein n=1 Tax=Verrucomicrobium spinosum TaxID=2736 RepID=UPI00017455AC|nr:GYF domain-containing protein [Verrucomicrobium spinosum]